MTPNSVDSLVLRAVESSNPVVWLADQVLVLSQHHSRVRIERTDDSWHSTVGSNSEDLSPKYHRLLRPLLARLAKVLADETGGEFDPYGCEFAIRRAGIGGPVRLKVSIRNTPGEQRLAIERTELDEAPRAVESGGAGAPAARDAAYAAAPAP